ncbi:MAG: YlxR family protein [Elainellaceae cyanobacterium]
MEPNYRRCISCRQAFHKSAFWRIVRTHPMRTVQLDIGAGRSAYICPNEDCLRMAQRKNRLARVLKAPVPSEIYEELWNRLKPGPSISSSDG